MNFAYAQPAAKHERKHGAITDGTDGPEQFFEIGVAHIPRQSLAHTHEMVAGNDRRLQRHVAFEAQPFVERAQRGQPAVDGCGLLATGEAVLHILVDIPDAHFMCGSGYLCTEQPRIAGVVQPGAAVRILSGQPNSKQFN